MTLFKIAQRVSKYLGYFCIKIWHQLLSKIDQSGHTARPKRHSHTLGMKEWMSADWKLFLKQFLDILAKNLNSQIHSLQHEMAWWYVRLLSCQKYLYLCVCGCGWGCACVSVREREKLFCLCICLCVWKRDPSVHVYCRVHVSFWVCAFEHGSM